MLKISALLTAHQEPIEHWFAGQWRSNPPPFYASVDVRHASVKLAPVDTNLFPAGFNNLSAEFLPACIEATKAEIAEGFPSASRLMLVPESHTRNLYYLESLAVLHRILSATGMEIRIGSLIPDLTEARPIELPSGATIVLEPLVRQGDRVRVGNFDPDIVLLNNDLSAGRPPELESLAQPVVPPLALGWSNRRKSHHFAHYQQVTKEFAEALGIDPWLIDPIFRNCGEIDFEIRAGEECLAANVEAVLHEVTRKYREYGIEREPFVMVKADAGTYGMAVMAVKSPDDVRDLNRKQRNKMARTKEGRSVTQVLVQEGVYTDDACGTPPVTAEPVIYLIGTRVVGGFWRKHTDRGPTENLNSPGMIFTPMVPAQLSERFYAYGVVARLAQLAAARELREVAPPPPT